MICAIDLIINDEQEPMNTSLITSDESMITSPSNTINESWTTRKDKSRTRRRGRKLGLSDISTPIYQNDQYKNDESSLMTSDMSQVTEISTGNESSDAMLEELPQEEEMETSTRNKSQYLSLGEKYLNTPSPQSTNKATPTTTKQP